MQATLTTSNLHNRAEYINDRMLMSSIVHKHESCNLCMTYNPAKTFSFNHLVMQKTALLYFQCVFC